MIQDLTPMHASGMMTCDTDTSGICGPLIGYGYEQMYSSETRSPSEQEKMIIALMVKTLNNARQHAKDLENTTRIRRLPDDTFVADPIVVQGNLNSNTGVVVSIIKNSPDTVAFGHDHARNMDRGLGPRDKEATTLTGKPSYIQTVNEDIFVVEATGQRKNGTFRVRKRKVFDHSRNRLIKKR